MANNAETTLILYGRYAIGEYKVQAAAGEQWQYYLGDAELSVRQLVDGSGLVLLARTYAPFGILLAQEGSGASLFGYAGGQAGVSDLWYFGSGYFDPQTGQFLAQETNPLAPLAAAVLANPGGLLFGPLMLWNWRRRKKGGKLPPTGLFVLALLFMVGLVGCDNSGDITPPATGSAPALPPEIDPTRTPTSTATRIPTAIATATVVEPTSTPTCTWTPTSTQTSTPTITPTDDPRPAIPGEGTTLIIFDKLDTYPTPTPSLTPISTPTGTPSPESEFDPWSEDDKKKINDGAEATAEALRVVIHDLHPSWGLDANEAFRLVYNGAVKFTLTGTSCPEDCWARSTGSNNVDVYTQGEENLTSTYAHHWAVHELGHCFVNAVGIESNKPDNPIKILENAILEDRLLDRPTRPIGATREPDRLLSDNDYWGFAGPRWEWQRSKSTKASEIFADQFLGWVYGKWRTADNGSLTDAGQARSDFMNKYMPTWIEKAITNR